MSGMPRDRRAERRRETQAEIVAAAWEMVRENGLAGLALRDLGTQVGMRAQSLYSYFASKYEIYDAMFRGGYEAFIEWMEAVEPDDGLVADPVKAATHTMRRYVEFCTSDPVRYQLLFQRSIPGFEPSPESWAVALASYERTRQLLAHCGVADQATSDLWTATMTGLASQQISNDPGGDRWEQLIDRAVAMLLDDVRTQTKKESEKK
jgi:AcrR family transcriptional regulator